LNRHRELLLLIFSTRRGNNKALVILEKGQRGEMPRLLLGLNYHVRTYNQIRKLNEEIRLGTIMEM